MGKALADFGFGVLMLDQLRLVLMLIELLHTVRISVRSEALIMEPFLIVSHRIDSTGAGNHHAGSQDDRDRPVSIGGCRKRRVSKYHGFADNLLRELREGGLVAVTT